MARTTTEILPDAAVRTAKKYLQAKGYNGRVGGWIHRPDGTRTRYQGWRAFARALRQSRRLRQDGSGRWVVEDGVNG
jgi:hypothetical protein